MHIAGIAKGAGMIHPHMATMLSFITTDASMGERMLHNLLAGAADDSFNRVTVDGDTSTNDTVAGAGQRPFGSGGDSRKRQPRMVRGGIDSWFARRWRA